MRQLATKLAWPLHAPPAPQRVRAVLDQPALRLA